MFLDDLDLSDQYTSTVRSGLKLGMDGGTFDEGVHPAIVKVTYVEADANGLPMGLAPSDDTNRELTLPPAGDPRAIEADDDDDRDLLLPLLLVAGAVIIVVTGFITYRNT